MRCPVCKAENAQGPLCRRCKADLSLLFQLEEQRAQLLQAARADLSAGRWQQAADDADWMRSDEASLRLRVLTHLFSRDFAGAWEVYRELKAGKES
jgi:hypothetical protein